MEQTNEDLAAFWPCPPWCADDHGVRGSDPVGRAVHGGRRTRWEAAHDTHEEYVEVRPARLGPLEAVILTVVDDRDHARVHLDVPAAERVRRMLGEAVATLAPVTRATAGHLRPTC
ncbi:hypothetical protein Afil01_11810 [Actinorhabdospora filicis]|uniref:Uncharacterized protein n=1 Tax=Actinorhabdospora filicis TaxID=1785913 RepID=A0A9W6SIX6_9ACTN|nr:hypothetical protein [Actinorhabdospora filicis]GLZ76374.1 hypothetical protein Afil01_11810 [Actinorhabdospora filicis]